MKRNTWGKSFGLGLSVILIGGGIAAILLLDKCGGHKAGDALSISNSLYDSEYIIHSGTEVYTDSGASITNHNNLLDLQAYARSKNYSNMDFKIEGEINFGILIDFDQSANFSGKDHATIKLLDQTEDTYGFMVGSIVLPEGAVKYTGYINIGGTVSCDISTDAEDSLCYGAYFNSAVDGLVSIDGNFAVSSENGSGYGVFFNNTNENSTQMISGSFVVSGAYAIGTSFAGNTMGTAMITGVFSIRGISEYAVGVFIQASSVGSTQLIDGTFSITSAAGAYGVSFDTDEYGNAVISGSFTISGGYGYGTYGIFDYGNYVGSLFVGGIFVITGTQVEGIYISGTEESSNIFINATFILYSTGADQTSGITLFSVEDDTLNGTPTFYANDQDLGNWVENGQTENWNGSTSTQVGDPTIALSHIYDENTPQDAHFYINILESGAGTSVTTANTLYKNSLTSYLSQLSSTNNGKIWLTNIVNKI